MQINISGKYFKAEFYGVSKNDHRIDYDALRATAKRVKPKMIIAGASAYPRIIDFKLFREIADEVGAYLMVDMAHIAGLVAAGLHPSPIPHAHFVTTTTHKTLRGPRGGMILCGEEYAKMIDGAVFPGIQGGPLMNVIAAKAVSFKEALEPSFVGYQTRVLENAKALAATLSGIGYDLVSGGTDNHLMLVDLSNKGVTGKDASHMLDEVNITVNKNTIPFDTKSPFVTSGIRLGSPAMTTRGATTADMCEIAGLIDMTITSFETKKEEIKARAAELCMKYPIYGYLWK